MSTKFIVEVPCTVIDRYIIFAADEMEARRKIREGFMTEATKNKDGDYEYLGGASSEPVTHWDKAEIVGQIP